MKHHLTTGILNKFKKTNKDDLSDSGIESVTKDIGIIAKVKYFLTGLMTKKILIIAGCIGVVFLIFTNMVSSIQTIITPFTQVLASESIIQNYKSEYDRLQTDFDNKIKTVQQGFDDVKINHYNGQGSNLIDIICILSVEHNQDLKFNPTEKRRLNELYTIMNSFSTKTEIYHESVAQLEEYEVIQKDDEGNEIPITKTRVKYVPVQKKRIIIDVNILGLEDVINRIGFDKDKKEWVRQLSVSSFADLYPELDLPSDNIDPIEMQHRIKQAKQGNMTRKELINIAKSINGKVPYFWGGKSNAGFNPQWGRPTKVTAGVSRTTRTLRPFGLDCSGYVDWVYKTAGFGNILNDGTTGQWNNSYPIEPQELKIGDLAFKQPPSWAGINHIGIYIGISSAGERLFIHSASKTGVTINNYRGFKYWRRAYVKFKGD